MAGAFANIYMAAIETKVLSQSRNKALEWKRYIDDIFSLWDINRQEIEQFIELANRFHVTIKFTAEISDKEATFLDTIVYEGERFDNQSILDVSLSRLKPFNTHFTPLATH